MSEQGDIRCPRCSRLLARQGACGYDVLVGKRLITIREGELHCDRCGAVLLVRQRGGAVCVSVQIGAEVRPAPS